MACKWILSLAAAAALLLPACREKQPEPEPTPEIQQPEPPPQPEPEIPKVTAVDTAQDPADTPQWLPEPDELPGWVRTSAAQVFYAGDWSTNLHKQLVAPLAAFRCRSASTLQYESVAPNPSGVIVDITLIEAYHPDDAYGLFTALMIGRPDRRIGSLTSITAGTGGHPICWQGKYLIHAKATGATTSIARAAVNRLLAGLVDPIPSSDQPAIINFLPTAGRVEGKLWVARRHLNTLPQTVRRSVLQGQAADITRSLGLGMDTLVVVAALDVGTGEEHNYVWLVEYPTADAALEAYASYDNWRQGQTPVPLISIEKPVGRYLCGSWTLDQESIMPAVPEIVSKLPKQ